MGLSKDWRQKHPERTRELARKYYYQNRDRKIIRTKTYQTYSNLLKTSECDNCGSKDRLEFHHPEPYRFDNFVILCFNCHRILHGKLFSQFAKDWSNYSSQENSVGGRA